VIAVAWKNGEADWWRRSVTQNGAVKPGKFPPLAIEFAAVVFFNRRSDFHFNFPAKSKEVLPCPYSSAGAG
jgi:hypothetical protein